MHSALAPGRTDVAALVASRLAKPPISATADRMAVIPRFVVLIPSFVVLIPSSCFSSAWSRRGRPSEPNGPFLSYAPHRRQENAGHQQNTHRGGGVGSFMELFAVFDWRHSLLTRKRRVSSRVWPRGASDTPLHQSILDCRNGTSLAIQE